jgi:NitT/TauT family transport system ATP-binding protein
MIDITNLNKEFTSKSKRTIIFENLNVNFKDGEFCSILGPNGCGKSTLLNLITGLDEDYNGSIKINDSEKPVAGNIGYMMQKDLLLPWLSVIENIKLGIDLQSVRKESLDFDIDKYLNDLSIQHLKKEYPSKLSGGERQKVALVRTLILNKGILLLDEPFSAIDYNTRIELQSAIIKYAKEKKTTVILISHDIDEAITVSDRILILDHNPKGIKLDIPVELDIEDRNPINARKHPQFSAYFSELWDKYPRR